MTLSPGDIVLVDVVFTDHIGAKQRPVLVLSAPDSIGDFVAAMITSKPGHANAVALGDGDMTKGKLPMGSWVRCDRPLTVNLSTVVKTYGAAKASLMTSVMTILCPYIGCK